MDELTRLALRAQEGDGAALAAFVARTQAEVWRLCRHLVGAAEADDLTQETYARALRALPRFRAESSARSWLLVIARRTAADEVRRLVRRRRRGGADRAEVEPDPAGASSLLSCLDDLDDDRRAAFVLTQLIGLSYAEAAEVCDVPVGTIRSRVARAREHLVAAVSEPPDAQERRGG